MRNILLAVLFAVTVAIPAAASAIDECGPGCHAAPRGECVVDGWTVGAAPNECPVQKQRHLRCPLGYVSRYGSCFQR